MLYDGLVQFLVKRNFKDIFLISGTKEKDLQINEEIDKLRLHATSALLSGRRDIIVVASVSCIYGIGNPIEFQKNVITLKRDQVISRTKLLHQLVQSLYSRTEHEIKSGTFKVKGDVVTIYPSYGDNGYRIHFFGDEIEEIELFDLESNSVINSFEELSIFYDGIINTKDSTKVPMVLVGNKTDLASQREVSKEDGEKRSKEDVMNLTERTTPMNVPKESAPKAMPKLTRRIVYNAAEEHLKESVKTMTLSDLKILAKRLVLEGKIT